MSFDRYNPDVLKICLQALQIDDPLNAQQHLADQLPDTPAWQIQLSAGEDGQNPNTQTFGHPDPNPVTWTVRYEVEGLNATLRASRPVPKIRLAWELLHTHLQRRQAAETLATIDPLTRLPNRRGWENALDAIHGHPHTIGLLDLDDLKHINDAHGHAAADDILKQTATVLRQNLRADDTVARIGGDEFALILVGVQPASPSAKTIASRLRNALYKQGILASLGLGPDLETADQAMYAAKGNPRSTSVDS